MAQKMKTSLRMLGISGGAIALVTLLASCSSTENAVPKAESAQPLTSDVTQPVVTGVPEKQRINTKGGTKLFALVNGNAVSTSAVNRRMGLVKLRRIKGNRRSVAQKELIDESLQMAEARKYGLIASDKEVNASYDRFAKRNFTRTAKQRKILGQLKRIPRKHRTAQHRKAIRQLQSPPKVIMKEVLARDGVSTRQFKEYIRSQISWQRTVSRRLQVGGGGNSAVRPKVNRQPWLTEVGKDNALEKEYALKQVVFVIPKGQRGSLASKRRQAVNFRSRVKGCDNLTSLATGLKNVAVRDLGLVRSSRLPPVWRADIIKTGAGGVTKVKDTDKGVEMIAVCRTREVVGDPDANLQNAFAGKNLQKEAGAMEKKYMAELREKAVIERR